MTKKVDFIIAGAQKSGTSALDAYLREHPSLCMASKKETHFFDTEAYFQSTPDYTRYHEFFHSCDRNQLWGEATPIYLYWRNVASRIYQYNPDIKLIFLLRNPIERAFSHWNMEYARGRENLSFLEAIRNEQARCQEALPLQHRVYSYIDRGFYTAQLARFREYFPKTQMLLLKHEALRDTPQQVLDVICDFLSIEKFTEVSSREVHSRPYQHDMPEEARQYLQTQFADEIQTLEFLSGWNCQDWLS